MRFAVRSATLLFALALAPQADAWAQDPVTRLDEMLPGAVAFEMGGDAGPLQTIEQIVFSLSPDSPLRGPIEEKLLAALDSSATADAQRFLCQQLRVIGTERCVPALARRLTDPQLSHAARYALGRLEVPAASAALVRALDETSGTLQAGIIDTLGQRRCTEARAKLVGLLGGSEEKVAVAAAIALGRLGDREAAAALTAARPHASSALGLEIDNGLLNAAAQMAEDGEISAAAAIYQTCYRSQASVQMRCAGLRGLILTSGAPAAALLAEALQSDDVAFRRYGISLIGLVPGRPATETFVGALGALPAGDRVLLLRALGARGDGAASAAIARATRDDDLEVRLAALEALGNVGDASGVRTLARIAATSDGSQRNVARAALKSLRAADVNDELLRRLGDADAGTRVELILALAARGVARAVDPLLSAAAAPDASVRRAAIEALGTLAREAHLPALVQHALATAEPEDREAWLEAIGKAFLHVEDAGKRAAPVLAELSRAAAPSQPLLIRLLGKSGAAEALGTLRSSLDDRNPDVREAAVRALAEWPDARVAEDLLALLASGNHAQQQDLILEGSLRLAAQSDDPAAIYVQVLQHVRDENGKKAVLERLGLGSESAAALDVALDYLQDPALQAAAGVAALRIAYRLRNQDESRARSALQQVLAKVDHPDVQRRAQEVMNELDKYEGHILTWVAAGPFQQPGKDGAALYGTVFPPETSPDDAAWQPLTQGIGSWDINLEATYGALDFVAAYLRTRIWSDSEQDVQLEMGSDDGIRAWLNGKLLYDQWGEGSAAPRQKLVPARLRQGWNTLLLKVVDQQGGWVAACRIRRPDGSALEGLDYQAE